MKRLVPSIVRYAADGVQVGYAAMAQQAIDPANTIVSVKRLMGRGLADLADAHRFPYRFADAPGVVGRFGWSIALPFSWPAPQVGSWLTGSLASSPAGRTLDSLPDAPW